MANIKAKDINDLTDWNVKELRKLRITVKNRISALDLSKPKDLPASHPLTGMQMGECKVLLDKIVQAERKLAKS